MPSARTRCPAAATRSAPRPSISSITARSRGPIRTGPRRLVRHGLLLGRRERKFWELGDGIYVTAVGYAGGLTPNPTYEEVCSGRTGHNEVVLVVYDPTEDFLRDAAQDLLGKPRPDAGHAPGQRRRHPVPLRHLPVHAGAAQGRRGVEGDVRGGAEEKGFGPITTEILDAPPFYFAEDYHQQYLAKNPIGYCGLGGTGVSCPIGTGAKLGQNATA